MAATIASFKAFVSHDADAAVLDAFAQAKGFGAEHVHKGTIADATEYLKTNPSPDVLVVEIPSQEAAPELLDALAEVCDPATAVITVGKINEYSFYCWLMDIGITQYLLCPLTEQVLEGALQKLQSTSATAKQGKPPAKLIGVMGSRGGVGTTTVAINLAGILGEQTKRKIAIVDLDPQEGSVALTLDIQPSVGLRDVLEKPDRIDSLFLDRVMNKVGKYLSVLSAEEALADQLAISERAAAPLLEELKGRYDYVVFDIPRHLNHFTRACLQTADHNILVSDLSLLSLRDTLRMQDAMKDSWKIKPPMIVANRVGLAAKQEVPLADFEKAAGAKVVEQIPFSPDIFMPIGNDIAAVRHKAQPATRPLYRLAASIAPQIKPADTTKKSGGFSLFKKKG